MDYFLTPEGVLVLGFACALAGWFGKGIAAVLWRWWTGAPKQDRAAYFNALADLGAKLRASGMTVEEVRELEAILLDPSLTSAGGGRRLSGRRPQRSSQANLRHSNRMS